MNCGDYEDALMEFALGTLSLAETERLLAHLARGCPRCSALLAEFQTTLSLVPLALSAEAPPASVKQRLLDRAAQSATPPMPNHGAAVPPSMWESRWQIGPAFVRALAACALVALGLAFYQERSANNRLTAQVNQAQRQNADLRNSLAAEGETSRAIRSPSNLLVSMEGAATPGGVGRIFIDAKLGKWWFATQGLPPLPAGKTYEFWLIPRDQKPIPAGTFNVDASGTGYLTGAVPSNIGANAIAAVTDEPAGGVPQPTGQIQLKGAVGN